MSADIDIDGFLKAQGFGLPASAARGRAALEGRGLTRPGKLRLSVEKQPLAVAALAETFALHCPSTDCVAWAQSTGREPLPCETKGHCGRCGGSDNQRAVTDLVEACAARGATKIVIVGGSPSVREELERLVAGRLSLRLVDGTERRPIEKARADLEWADVELLWGATELHHKVSMQYTNATTPVRRKVVHVPKRGIAQLLAGAVAHLRR